MPQSIPPGSHALDSRRALGGMLLCRDEAAGGYHDPTAAPACDRIDPSQCWDKVSWSYCPGAVAADEHCGCTIYFIFRTIPPSIKMRQIGSQPGVIGIAAPVSPGVGPRAAVNSPSSVVGKRQCSTVVNGVLQKCFDRSAGRSLRRPH